MAFPTIDYTKVTIKEEDNAVKSRKENGKVYTRKRFTKARKTFTVELPILETADKEALVTHFDEVGTYLSFSWTEPLSGTVYVVRFEEPIEYTKGTGLINYWTFSPLKLMEV